MKLTYALAALVAAALSVHASETNAQRMARGLSPLPPRRLHSSRTTAGKHPKPSGSPGNGNGGGQQCSTGPVHCCNSLHKSDESGISGLLGILGLDAGNSDAFVGLNCSPINVLGIGNGECSAHTVCCENNSQGSLISIGCIPIIL